MRSGEKICTKAVAGFVCAVLLVGCARARKPKPVPAPFRPPAVAQPSPPAYLLTESAPPLSWQPLISVPFLPALALPPLPPPPKPKPLPPPAVAQPPAAVPAAPSIDLELRPLLSPAQAKELERQINERLARARSAVRSLEGRALSREQTGLLNQIRTFIEQAEQARRNDLPRARNLAERAEVLALDLARQVSR